MRVVFAAAALLLCGGAQAAEKSCTAEIGAAKAAELVHQCTDISPATHPPCNAANACSLIKSEIQRGCDLARQDSSASVPPYCAEYPTASQPGGY